MAMVPTGSDLWPQAGAPVSWNLLVLTEDEGCQRGHNGAQAARDGPPGVLDEEAEDDEDAAEGAVHKHHLRRAPQDPVQELEHWGFVCNGTGQGVTAQSGGPGPRPRGWAQGGGEGPHPRWVCREPAPCCHLPQKGVN